jgi:hypothetical protein
MTRFMTIVARLSFAALLMSAAIGLVAGFGTRLHLWDYRVGLLEIFPCCVYAGLAAFALGLGWVFTAIVTGEGEGARYGAVGFAGAIALMTLPIYDLVLTRTLPPIHDISTDTEHAPEFVTLRDRRPDAANPPDYDGPKRVRFEGRTTTTEVLQKDYYADIRSYSQLGTTPAKLFDRALAAAQTMGWTIVAVVPDARGGRIEATDSTLLFGLTDDIVIRVQQAGIGARLDMRSKSRVGANDIGRNAARIRAYLKKLAAS